MFRFINTELKSDSESSDSELDLEDEPKYDNELMQNKYLVLIKILNKTLLLINDCK